MFATIITATLFRTGFKAAYLSNPAPKPYPLKPVITDGVEFDPAVFETAAILYVPILKKCVEVGNDDWPEDLTTGLLTADVLMIEHLGEVNPHSTHWGVDYMSEGGWEDVKNAAPELHAIVEGSRLHWEATEKERRGRGARSAPLRDLDALSYECEFIGLWEPETSRDWESGHEDIDAINFAGEGTIVPLEKPSIPPQQPLSIEGEIG
jgi:hypothetical protein